MQDMDTGLWRGWAFLPKDLGPELALDSLSAAVYVQLR